MRDFRSHYAERWKAIKDAGINSIFRLDENQKAHVILYSHFFTDLPGNFLCTNRMYREFQAEVDASIALVNVKKPVVLEIYEPHESDEFDREAAITGFRTYLQGGLTLEKKRFRRRMYVFDGLLLIGILLEILLYGLDLSLLPEWVDSCVDIVATVFVWQFVGFMAYEYKSYRMQFKRLRQMIGIEYIFKKWE